VNEFSSLSQPIPAGRFAGQLLRRLQLPPGAGRRGAAARPPAASTTPEVDAAIGPETPAAEVFPIVARPLVTALARARTAALAGDADAVHEMRIALRQLRVALKVCAFAIGVDRVRSIVAESQWLSEELGRARDIDVFIESLGKATRPPTRGGRAGATPRALEGARTRLYARLAQSLCSARYRKLLGDVRQAIAVVAWQAAQPADSRTRHGARADRFAARELHRRRKKFIKAARRLNQLNSSERHHVRIRGRKLRYAMEFFGNAYRGKRRDERHRDAVATLKKLQDALGALHDLTRQRALVRRYLPRATAAGAGVSERGATRDRAMRARLLLRAALRAFHAFESVEPFWE
jgi:triphosphatase